MQHKSFIFILLLGIWVLGCAPDRDNDIQLPPTPAPPQFSVEPVQGDSNRWVIRDLSEGNFQRLWDLPGGLPKTSVKTLDTVMYSKAGEYAITLYVSKTDGSGTPSASRKINVPNDANPDCTPKLSLLTGDCGPQGKCWTFTHDAGAVKVGPTYDDYSWYTSPANGLQAEQYDDGFCFTFEGFKYQNNNNGASINPWDGYKPQAYNPGVSEFIFSEGSGTGGRDQIILPDNQFMGVWDADNVMDVVKLTATELIVRMRLREQNGTPKTEGWFELRFVPK